MSEQERTAFGRIWFEALTAGRSPRTGLPGSLLVADAEVAGEPSLVLAVVTDPQARFPRARRGEVGLEEGWGLARVVLDAVEADRALERKRPVIVVVDVPSQAYGYVEELAGIHQALAGSVNAFATARLAGHPVVAFIAGQAISGAFLATGLQANRIVALDHDGIAVQVMSKASAARITRRTIAELDQAAEAVPATAYDGASFAKLGAVHELITPARPAAPTAADLASTVAALARAVEGVRAGGSDLKVRLTSDGAQRQRAASVLVRKVVAAEWN